MLFPFTIPFLAPPPSSFSSFVPLFHSCQQHSPTSCSSTHLRPLLFASLIPSFTYPAPFHFTPIFTYIPLLSPLTLIPFFNTRPVCYLCYSLAFILSPNFIFHFLHLFQPLPLFTSHSISYLSNSSFILPPSYTINLLLHTSQGYFLARLLPFLLLFYSSTFLYFLLSAPLTPSLFLPFIPSFTFLASFLAFHLPFFLFLFFRLFHPS